MVVTATNKHINSLVSDINEVLKENFRYSESGLAKLSTSVSEMFVRRLGVEETENKDNLRMSNFGTKCDRKLWYTVNKPEVKEPILPHTYLKFMYGDLLEEVVLNLSEEAGHKVEGRQETLEIDGVVGHRDAVIDGVTVDVKSANSRSFAKFKKELYQLQDDIWFSNYLDQLDLYMEAGLEDDKVTIKRVGGFLVVDQEMGHLNLKLVPKSKKDWKTEIKNKKEMVLHAEPPAREFEDQADGVSGNRKLNTYCSYCQFKKICWPGLRTFISSTGPKHLTKVVREPNMLEIKND